MTEKIEAIGRLDTLDTRLDWLVKFSIATDSGTVWLSAKTKQHRTLADGLSKHDKVAPIEDRPIWCIQYTEEESPGKDGKIYTNRWVTSAKTIETPVGQPKATGGGFKDDAIKRAVAFKGAIDLLVAAKSKVELTKVGAIGTVGELMQVAPILNTLTNDFEAILDRSYRADEQATIQQAQDDGFEEI